MARRDLEQHAFAYHSPPAPWSTEQAERGEPERPRTVPVDKLPAGDLHHQVRDEERRRQETDRSEAHAVPIGEHVGGGTDVGDVVADGSADPDAGDGRD